MTSEAYALVGPTEVTASLHPPRWHASCELAGVHSGKRVLPDTEEAAGSNPAAPTICRVTSGNAGLSAPLGLPATRKQPAQRYETTSLLTERAVVTKG